MPDGRKSSDDVNGTGLFPSDFSIGQQDPPACWSKKKERCFDPPVVTAYRLFKVTGGDFSGVSVTLDPKLKQCMTMEGVSIHSAQVSGTFVITPGCAPGTYTLTAQSGNSPPRHFNFDLWHTKSQALKQAYAKDPAVQIRGHWPERANPQDIAKSRSAIDVGLHAVWRTAARDLGIVVHAYDTQSFNITKVVLDGPKEDVVGFARRQEPVMFVDLDQHGVNWSVNPKISEVSRVIFHESVHLVHFALRGRLNVEPTLRNAAVGLVKDKTGMQGKWNAVNARVKECPDIPIITPATWRTKAPRYEPQCGFIEAYGANNERDDYGEDIATLAETFMFSRGTVTSAMKKPYGDLIKDKVDLLIQYRIVAP